MTASDDIRPERSGPVDDRAGQRAEFPVRRGAAAAGRGPTSRDDALVGGRARFRSDRRRTWAAREELLPGGRPVPLGADSEPTPDGDAPPPLPTDLRLDRLEVVHDATPAARTAPSPRTGWPAAPQPPTVQVPGSAPVYPSIPAQAQGQVPAAVRAPSARPMPPSVGRGDGSITRVDPADLLPGPATASALPGTASKAAQASGRRAASAQVPAPLDDLMPHPQQRPYGVDLPTSTDKLFPPSSRPAPPDLLSRRPAGTSTGLQPRIFAPGTGTDESALPVLVGDPAGPIRLDPRPGIRPDPRLPLPPPPPADLDVTQAWGAAPPPVGTAGLVPATRTPGPAPVTAAALGGAPDVSDLASLFAPRPMADGHEQSGYGASRVGHAAGRVRRQSAEPPPRRGWAVPTITAAIGLVAGIVFASSSDPTALPAPAKTVVRTITVAPTP